MRRTVDVSAGDYNTGRNTPDMKNLVEKFAGSINWQRLPEFANWVLEQGLAIQKIPAPTFYEQRRAAYVEQQFKALGLRDVETDAMFNVYGRFTGSDSSLPAVMVVAHTDTVFGEETRLETRREDSAIYGPGLGDNSMGVAGLLGVVHILNSLNLTPQRDLWLVASTREEGLGDLGGMKAAFSRLQSQIGAVINLEGLAFGHIYHAGIAVKRLKIDAQTEGGHSWLHFGRASAIHGLMQLGTRITGITLPASPRTTYNIGVISGGQSINSIAASASMWLDMRSEQRDALDALEREVRSRIQAMNSAEMTFAVEVVGDRPAGYLDPDHALVQGAIAALAQVGLHAALETGSTDGNVPLAAGVPTVTVGITRGGNAHRLDEYIETGPIAAGMKQLVILVMAASNAVK
jgi:tripeptide aminopeptidase